MQHNLINQTDKPILFYWPAGGGGKFLMACLSLADNALFPDFRLVNNQSSQDLSQLEKFNILINRLDDSIEDWNDFLLTPTHFSLSTNIHQYWYNFSVLELLDSIVEQNPTVEDFLKLDSMTENIIENDKFYFFTMTHNIFHLYFYSKFWKNGSIVYFNNAGVFLKHFRKEYIEKAIDKHDNYSLFRYVNAIRKKYISVAGKDWPKFSLVIKNNEIFDNEIKEEIKNNFPLLYKDIVQMKYYIDFYKSMSQKSSSNKVVNWNTGNFFDKNLTLDKIETLYNELNLTNYNRELIEKLYDQWIFCLNRLKDINNNIFDKEILIEKIKKYKDNNDFKNATIYVYKLKELLN